MYGSTAARSIAQIEAHIEIVAAQREAVLAAGGNPVRYDHELLMFNREWLTALRAESTPVSRSRANTAPHNHYERLNQWAVRGPVAAGRTYLAGVRAVHKTKIV